MGKWTTFAAAIQYDQLPLNPPGLDRSTPNGCLLFGTMTKRTRYL
jgi:hypothetical protein